MQLNHVKLALSDFVRILAQFNYRFVFRSHELLAGDPGDLI